jgi:hypothetical protein
MQACCYLASLDLGRKQGLSRYLAYVRDYGRLAFCFDILSDEDLLQLWPCRLIEYHNAEIWRCPACPLCLLTWSRAFHVSCATTFPFRSVDLHLPTLFRFRLSVPARPSFSDFGEDDYLIGGRGLFRCWRWCVHGGTVEDSGEGP